MSIRSYTLNQAEEWDSIVRSFSDYDVFYLSDYSRAFLGESSDNGNPVLLYYNKGNDRAINVVLSRDISMDENFSGIICPGEYYDLISPYGYGGYIGNVTDWSSLIEEHREYCERHNYVCEFVRFELFSDYYKYYDGIVETRTHNVVRSLSLSDEDIWKDFKQKVRKNVNKASRIGLECYTENKGEYLDDYLRIYYETMERTNAKKSFFFSRRFFEDLIKMKSNTMFFHVIYEGRIISTELVLYGSENCYSYLGGTKADFFEMRPNDYLKYEIIKWAKQKGLKNFVLGGGYGSDDGIFQYKASFAPQGIYDFHIGKRVFNVKTYEKLVCLRNNNELNYSFFPLYRS